MSAEACENLYELTQRWSARLHPTEVPTGIAIERLPRSSYDGDNAYNGFTGAERRKAEQVIQVLRRRGHIEKPVVCDLCGSKTRVGFHGEDYFDPFSMIRVCFPCHMAIHGRFKSVAKWLERLDLHAERPLIAEFRALPMKEIDFAQWLRANTTGPHDVVKRTWPDKIILDYEPRPKRLSSAANQFAIAILAARPTETEWNLLDVLERNPGATSASMSAKLGWSGDGGWHMKVGQLCRRLDSFLGTAPTTHQRRQPDGSPAKFYTGLIADFDDETRGFQMKPEVVEALRAIRKKIDFRPQTFLLP